MTATPSRTSTRSPTGPGFRKIRRALGVTAFGVNAIEIPPGFQTGRHFHDEQEELYFVHRGRIGIRLNDETEHVLGPGGLARVDAATVRQIENVGDEPAVYLIAGGKDGYVGRDGQAARGRDEPLRAAGDGDDRERPADSLVRQRRHSGAAALAGCPVFPADNHWNLRVDELPVHPSSDAIVRSIGASEHMHADFGSGLYQGAPIGIPYVTVPRQPAARAGALRLRGRVGPRPLPDPAAACRSRAAAASDGDRHVIVVDRARCRLYELFDAHPRRRRRALARRLGGDLQPALEPAAPARLDVGRRRRPADPARARALRRGAARPDRPRAPLHRVADAARVHLPGAPLRLRASPTRTCPRWASACG